ncbi:nitric oxide-dependent regulator DnrN or NorA [Klebsiella pneumoniae]|uniref:Nitric oxide-dependent regulator DnrN or NorA n=1 Tax=Klebsiella pneumoniae TaxID=573 RepID=A0A377TM79_KLEPN|nr:nitric oxide-dependent regulator DnrN or NorA [Klebsiella pneumoniae]
MAFRDQPLGELALTIPRASALFRQYDMDYCCGGKQTLARAASRKALDVAVIEAELAKLPNSLFPATGARRPSRRLSTISSFAITTGTVNSCRS